MKKKTILMMMIIGLLLCVLLFLFIDKHQEESKIKTIEQTFQGFYVRDSLAIRQNLRLEDLEELEAKIKGLKDEALQEGYSKRTEELRLLLILREDLKEVENRPIQEFSGEIYRRLLVQVNTIQDVSTYERERLYALKEDYDDYLKSKEKLETLSALTEELINIDPTNPEEVKRVLDTVKALGAEDLLEEHMGDLWERYALAESLEEYLNNTGTLTPEDAKAFTDLISSMQQKGMKVDDYLELSRVMSLLVKVNDVGLLGLSTGEFFELLEFYNKLDRHEQKLLAEPLFKEIQKQLRNLLGNLG